jgi:hypothetical protein
METAPKNRIKNYRNKIIVAKILCPELAYAGGVHAT